MKKETLFGLLLLALGVCALPACAKPVDQLPDDKPCSTQVLSLEGRFSADVVLTNVDTGEILHEGEVGVLVFQSGGTATYWGGAIGTAQAEAIVVDYEYPIGGYTYELVGIADDTRGVFTERFSGGEVDNTTRYEFTNLQRVTPQAYSALQFTILFGDRFGALVLQE